MFENPLQMVLGHAEHVKRSSTRRRKPCRPLLAQRNLAIFKKVEIEGLSHDEAAHRFRLRRSRVSQIVKQVRGELAEASADDPSGDSAAARLRLERQMEKLRLEHALEAAAYALRRDPPSLVTQRSGCRDKEGRKEGWSETVTRDKPPNVQIIKTFLRVAQDLGKLHQREAEDSPPPQRLSEEDMFQAINDVLEDWFGRMQCVQERPSSEFVMMVQYFRASIFSWVIERRKGVPPELAYGNDDFSLLVTNLANWQAAQINRRAQKINPALTAPDDAALNATTDEHGT